MRGKCKETGNGKEGLEEGKSGKGDRKLVKWQWKQFFFFFLMEKVNTEKRDKKENSKCLQRIVENLNRKMTFDRKLPDKATSLFRFFFPRKFIINILSLFSLTIEKPHCNPFGFSHPWVLHPFSFLCLFFDFFFLKE